MGMKFAICKQCQDNIRDIVFEGEEPTKEDTICPYCGKHMIILDRINDCNNYIWFDLFSLASIIPLPARIWSETNNKFVKVNGLNSDDITIFVYDNYNNVVKALSEVSTDSDGNILFYLGLDRDISKEYLTDDGGIIIQPTEMLREEYNKVLLKNASKSNSRSPFKDQDSIIEFIMLKLYGKLF